MLHNLHNLLFNFVFFSGEEARDTPYEVNVTIPVEGYEPIQFTLTKMCSKLTFLLSWKPLSISDSQFYVQFDALYIPRKGSIYLFNDYNFTWKE